MSKAIDLREALKNWPYDPDNDARIAEGEDGRQILQVRTPVGLEQYELEGRPDGERPEGMESVLAVHEQRLEAARAGGREESFGLGPQDCADLFNEGTLYYFRYVRLFQLRDWERTIRDTNRNLRVFDLVHRHARREEDQQFLEKWRPYIVRVNASAAALQQLEQRAHDRALRIVSDALDKIHALAELEDPTFIFERDRSVAALTDLRDQIQKNRPLSALEQLEQQMGQAIQRQEFERAARLRDRIRELRKQHIC